MFFQHLASKVVQKCLLFAENIVEVFEFILLLLVSGVRSLQLLYPLVNNRKVTDKLNNVLCNIPIKKINSDGAARSLNPAFKIWLITIILKVCYLFS
jgi:hypothetical protein